MEILFEIIEDSYIYTGAQNIQNSIVGQNSLSQSVLKIYHFSGKIITINSSDFDIVEVFLIRQELKNKQVG